MLARRRKDISLSSIPCCRSVIQLFSQSVGGAPKPKEAIVAMSKQSSAIFLVWSLVDSCWFRRHVMDSILCMAAQMNPKIQWSTSKLASYCPWCRKEQNHNFDFRKPETTLKRISVANTVDVDWRRWGRAVYRTYRQYWAVSYFHIFGAGQLTWNALDWRR